jgi:hypothetical protein
MHAPPVILNSHENRVRRLAARQRMCLIRRRTGRGWGVWRYALTDAFGAAEPRSRAFGFDKNGSPAATLDEIEAYLKSDFEPAA